MVYQGGSMLPPWYTIRQIVYTVDISASREKIPTFFESQKQKVYDAQIALTGMAGQLMHGDE
jgi:hypothetical protein